MSKVKTLGEEIDDLVDTVCRVAECSVEEAIEIIKNRMKKYMETQL